MSGAVTIPALLDMQAGLGDKLLLVADHERLTYGEAERRSAQIASAMLARGVARGSQVALLFGNGADFALAFLAVTRIGAVAIPLSALSTAHELGGLLRGCDAEFLIAAAARRERVIEAIGPAPFEPMLRADLPALRKVWFGIADLEIAGETHDPRVARAGAQVSAADWLAIVHTSGSTSTPKGVIHTHGQVIRNMRRLNAVRAFLPEDRLFSNSPWFWIGGLAYSFLATVIAGGRLICSAATPRQMLDLLEAERPTMTNGVASTMLALAADPSFAGRDLSSMRRGNLYPVMPADVRPADPELRYNLLGMTEAGSVCLIGPHERDLPEAKRGSFGFPVEGAELRIVDPDSGAPGDAGELWLRGANIMQGYLGRERHECFDAEGWYHTGDMVSRDADGDIFFKGRGGDIIRTSGAQVSPREVEGAISDLTGGQLAIVVGVPDAQRGQAVTAVMVGDAPYDEAALLAGLRRQLSPFKVPRRFVGLSEKELPVLSSGKVDLRALVELISDR